MTDPENFLERWSRKKREAEAAPETPKLASDVPAPAQVAALDQGEKSGTPPTSPAALTPKFDLASLPSLESITATTDIRAFFTPGVPPELTRAALRRAWSVDPAIRDFVGLQENDWDFTAPNGVPGFGELPPDFDVKKLVAQIFGEPDKEREAAPVNTPLAAPSETQRAAIVEESAPLARPAGIESSSEIGASRLPTETAAVPQVAAEQLQVGLVQRDNDTASHNTPDVQCNSPKTLRRHGRALPK
jgi:hypothetical protein